MPTKPIIRWLYLSSIFSLLITAIKPYAYTQTQGSPNAPPPNLILILTDDQPWHTMPFMPLTRQLVGDQGVTFTRAYVSTPYCCPSRASILTGQFAHNHGVIGNEEPAGGAVLFDDTSTLATWIQNAGYRTGLVGKYLNEYWKLTPYIPIGWDQWFALSNRDLGVGGDYQRYSLNENGVEVHYNGTGSETYSTNVLRDKAVNFIRSTPAGQPLFLYFAPNAPHTIIIPDPADAGLFENLEPYRPPSYNEADVSDKPAWLRQINLLTGGEMQQIDDLYRLQALALQPVDRAVQAIVQALEDTGRLSNTVVIYTTDNGYALGDHRLTRKNCVYEVCVKVPLLIRAPGVIPRVDDHLVQNVDLAVTLADFAGVAPPAPVDGKSLVDLLHDPQSLWKESIFLEVLDRPNEYIRNFQAIHTGEVVYAEYANGDRELYNLAVDPDQLYNQIGNPDYASTAAQLASDLAAYKGATDLTLTGSIEAPASSGSEVTVSYTVTNDGLLVAAPLTLRLNIPSGMQLISCQAIPGGVCFEDDGSRRVRFRLLRPGESAEVRVVLTRQGFDPLLLTTEVTAFSPLESDPLDNLVDLFLNPFQMYLPIIHE
jgi:arylsulfatase A-like enzyme